MVGHYNGKPTDRASPRNSNSHHEALGPNQLPDSLDWQRFLSIYIHYSSFRYTSHCTTPIHCRACCTLPKHLEQNE